MVLYSVKIKNMAKCDYCGGSTLFGGTRVNQYSFCSRTCQNNGYALITANEIPEHYLQEQVNALHQGACPRCKGAGPVDVHTSHFVWSAVIMTRWSSTPHVCCRHCGQSQQIQDTLLSLLVGWWGFPWGIIMTPVQVIRNVSAMTAPPSNVRPSDELRRIVQIMIGSQILKSRQ